MRLDAVVYEHAAALIGRDPRDVSRDAALLAEAHLAAHRAYGHRPVTVGIDLYNVEAEALGACLGGDAGCVPVVVRHPCAEAADLARLPVADPARDGRLPLLLEAGRRVAEALPGVPVAVPAAGPFSLATGLMGLDGALCAAACEADALAAGLDHLCDNQERWLRAIVAAGLAPVIFESAAGPPLLSPDQFRSLVAPRLARLMQTVRAAGGAAPALIVGGDTAGLVDDLAATGAGALICPAETDQAAFVTAASRHPGLRLRLNLEPRLFAAADPGPAIAAARAAARLAACHPLASLGTGVLGLDARPETVRATVLALESGPAT